MAPSTDTNDVLPLVRRYLAAIEASDESTLRTLLDEGVVYRELPNRLVPAGSINDRAVMLARFAQGKKLLSGQRYEILNAVISGNTAAVEVAWTGVLSVPLGSLAVGDTMRAFSGIFLEVRDGRIVGQRNYDCIPPF